MNNGVCYSSYWKERKYHEEYMAFSDYRTCYCGHMGIMEVYQMTPILSHTIVAIGTLCACCYIMTIDHTAQTAVFAVMGSVAGYYFGRMTPVNGA